MLHVVLHRFVSTALRNSARCWPGSRGKLSPRQSATASAETRRRRAGAGELGAQAGRVHPSAHQTPQRGDAGACEGCSQQRWLTHTRSVHRGAWALVPWENLRAYASSTALEICRWSANILFYTFQPLFARSLFSKDRK